MQNRAQSFKQPTSWNSGQSLQLGWVPCEVSTFIYMPIPRAVSLLFWTEKIILACGTRQTLWVPKHGNVFFYTERMVREREREERKDGVLCGIVRCLSTKEMREQLHNDPLWGGERCPGHGTAPSLGSATEPGREMFIKPHRWARASSCWQGPVAQEAILHLCSCSVEVPWQGLQVGWPSGASQASLCGWLGGPAAGHPDRTAEATPASASTGSSRMSPWDESRCLSPAAPCGEVTATQCSSNLAKNQMRGQMFREQNVLC